MKKYEFNLYRFNVGKGYDEIIESRQVNEIPSEYAWDYDPEKGEWSSFDHSPKLGSLLAVLTEIEEA